MRLLVYKGFSKYDALRVFADELIGAFRSLDIEVDVVGEEIEQYGEELIAALPHTYDGILSMNGVLAQQPDASGENFNNLFHAPFYAYLVDHPYMHHERLLAPIEDYHVICVEDTFAAYVREYYENIQDVQVLPQGGIEGEDILPIAKRPLDVVFLGTYRGYHEIYDKISQDNIKKKEVFQGIICELMQHRNDTLEQAFLDMLNNYGVSLPKGQFAEDMSQIKVVDDYIRAYMRENAVKELVDAGIQVDVYGDGWENLYPNTPSNLHVHPPVSYYENVSILGNAKIVLHVAPWAKAGFHDRLACGMLNGAVCVGDESTYLSEHLQDGIHMRFFQLDKLNKLSSIIKELLQDVDGMQKIADCGRAYAKENHTWKIRANEIAAMIRKQEVKKHPEGIFYIAVPSAVTSPLVESQYQLAYVINEIGGYAKLFCYGEAKEGMHIPKEYEKYHLRFQTNVPTQKNCGFLLSEQNPQLMNQLRANFCGKIFYYWGDGGFCEEQNETASIIEETASFLKETVNLHLFQNDKDMKKAMEYSWMNQDKGRVIPRPFIGVGNIKGTLEKEDQIIYDPGMEDVVTKIKEHIGEIHTQKVESTPNGKRLQFLTSKLYLEDGSAQNKEHLRQMAVAAGCCVVLVNPDEDEENIPTQYAVQKVSCSEEDLGKKINWIFSHFSEAVRDFGRCRMEFRKEETKLKKELKLLLQYFDEKENG